MKPPLIFPNYVLTRVKVSGISLHFSWKAYESKLCSEARKMSLTLDGLFSACHRKSESSLVRGSLSLMQLDLMEVKKDLSCYLWLRVMRD